MRRLIHTIFITLLISVSASAQVGFMDYRDGAQFHFEGVSYRVNNSTDKIMSGPLIQEKGTSISLSSTSNTRMNKIGLYTDGHYAEDYEEVSGIIQGKPSNDDTVYAAVRTAFTKEELMAHSNWVMWVIIAVDNTGRIIETASVMRIHPNYVIQPEQIHILETILKNTLVFTLDPEKASKFEWFEGQIMIRFKDYIEDRTLSKIDNLIESPDL